MKPLFLIISVLFFSTNGSGQTQFTAMPLNYLNDNTLHTPEIVSIVDENTVWVATHRQNSSNLIPMPYSTAITSNDGGITWQFLSIPVAGSPYMNDVEALNASVCYYFFIDLTSTSSSIWKTVDGGLTWLNKSPNQFTTGYGDFLHLFSQDTLIAIGDPTNGYFEIQISNDGGDNWTRVPQTDIPPILSGEAGFGGKTFGSFGNTLWFPTSKGRCFKSVDKGRHWTVSIVDSTAAFNLWTVCFSDLQNGIFYCKNAPCQYYKTSDGGESWTKFHMLQHLFWTGISRIEGIPEGFILSASDTVTAAHSYIYTTNDLFTTVTPLDTVTLSTNFIYFKDGETGWLSGMYHPDNNIYKFIGNITGVPEKPKHFGKLSIIPNPSNCEALVIFPDPTTGPDNTIKIFDHSGKMVEEIQIKEESQSIHLNSSRYPNGIYQIIQYSRQICINNGRWIVFH